MKLLAMTSGHDLHLCAEPECVSSTSEDPESGLKFLNWLYASEENHDLFHYGIEGTHYTKTGDHRIEQVKGDDGNPLYSMDTWMTGYLPYMAYATDTPDEQVDYMTYKSDNYVISPAQVSSLIPLTLPVS